MASAMDAELKRLAEQKSYVPEGKVLGFALITAAATKEVDVYNALGRIKEVVKKNGLIGIYDIIAKIEDDSVDKVSRIIKDRITTIPGVMDVTAIYTDYPEKKK